jgi:beta-glucosidase
VILETGGPVLIPWLDKIGAVLAAWYPGQRGGLAIARVVTGAVNPSGRLPITFPKSIDQTPHPQLPGGRLIKSQDGREIYDQDLKPFDIDYTEGADVGYRWYDRNNGTALFAFGYGLTTRASNTVTSRSREATACEYHFSSDASGCSAAPKWLKCMRGSTECGI